MISNPTIEPGFINQNHHHAVVDFSITKSGLFYKLLLNLGLAGTSKKDFIRRSLVICGITWLPLLILSLLQGLAFGNKVEVTFLKDFATHTRLLMIIPLLIFAEGSVDFQLKELTTQFFTAGILNETDIPRYDAIKAQMRRLSESLVADLIILLIVVSNILVRFTTEGGIVSQWVFLPGHNGYTISWPGIWAAACSLGILQYLILRWIWRWIIWVIYFNRIASLPLKLNPAHPDLAGGIGFIGVPPGPFLSVTLAFSILFSVVIAERIIFLNQELKQFYPVTIGLAAVIIIINVIPLLVFMKPLLRSRRKGIFEYSALIQEHHRQFDKKWIGNHVEGNMLGMQEASSMIDLNSSFNTVMKMRVIPFNLKIMLSSVIVCILPLIPLLAFEYNWLDIINQVLRMLM